MKLHLAFTFALALSVSTFAQTPQQMADANAQLTGALGRLIAVSEAYPQLKADQQFTLT